MVSITQVSTVLLRDAGMRSNCWFPQSPMPLIDHLLRREGMTLPLPRVGESDEPHGEGPIDRKQ